MEKTTDKQEQHRTIRQRFDNALMGHMKRLLGKSRLPDSLPLNLLNVSCLVLLAEQGANEERQFSTPEDRYTRELLYEELAEIGLDSEAAFEAMLQQMLQLEYVHMNAAGLIEGGEPALQVAQQIDAILPQMPGLNLIAYIAQTIDEAVSGRKKLDDAVDQFDQTLMQQGVPAGERKPEAGGNRPGAAASGPSMSRGNPERKETKSKSLLSAEDYKDLQNAFKKNAPSSADSSEPRILSSNGSREKADVQVISFGAPSPEAENIAEEKLAGEPIPAEEISGQPPSESSAHKTSEDRAAEDRATENGVPENTIPEDGVPENRTPEDGAPKDSASEDRTPEDGTPDDQPSENRASEDGATEGGGQRPEVGGKGPEAGTSETEIPEDKATEDRTPEDSASENGGQRSETGVSEDGEAEHGSLEEGGKRSEDNSEDASDIAAEPEDDDIESRINAFEENLSMQCPICKTGEITAEQTIKKKTYFKCLNRACNFISWGKPYHQMCPRCHNPFLIEQQRKSKTILKCPRSTCDYWQGDPADPSADTAAQQPATKKPGKSKPRRRVVKRRVVRRKKA